MYRGRFADEMLKNRLSSAGAVLIRGPKGCGKTETALQVASSHVRMDIDDTIKLRMEIEPASVLVGEIPRLIDEWQEYPVIWSLVRHEVDKRKRRGQFILTGSSSIHNQARLHSGAGRFSILSMRPMSFFERGWSTGEVSLEALMQGDNPTSKDVFFSLEDMIQKITMGGWPGLIGANGKDGLQFMRDYLTLTAEVDVSKASGVTRDPLRVMRLLQSFARNISTEASLSAIMKDTNGFDGMLSRETISNYIEALERLMIVEQLPAWSTHIRSADTLRVSAKRHFVDPSLAVGALNLSKDKLMVDLKYLGFLFESLVLRDLRIYADLHGGKLFHYRDSRDLEIDMVIEYPDGRWAACEVKLGFAAQDEAAHNLLTFAKKVDSEKMGPPQALFIITGNGFAHVRKDGVAVIPLGVLTA